jgi:predicted Zn-dependent peptidase
MARKPSAQVGSSARTAAGSRRVRARSAEQIARTALGPRPLPDLQRTRTGRAPSTERATLDSGLQVIAVRRPSSPMVELRLRIPFGGHGRAHAAHSELLAETILLGTDRRSRQDVDAELAVVGGQLSAQVDPQRLLLSGSALSAGLEVLLDVLADTVTGAAYRAADIRRERDRLVEHLVISNAQPSVIAREHLQYKRFGDHPAALEVPDPDLVATVTPAAVRGLHRRAVLPAGSSLVLVGDLHPARTVAAVAQALAGWTATRPAGVLAEPPVVPGGPVTAHHRAGAVQSQARLTTPGVLRSDPGYPAAQLANIVFGGYFSSRLVENLREDKGYTYHAYSMLEFWPGRSAVTIGYDTTTEVTAAALLETRHELGRLALLPPTDAEVDAARNYAIGSLAGSLSNQAGYASMLSALAGSGLDIQWLRAHPANLLATTTEQVADAAARMFAPSAVTGIVVGDLDATGAALSRLGEIELP